MATLYDAMSQYATNRMGSIQDRINQAGEYFTDPQAALARRLEEEEEERRRREREERLKAEILQQQTQQAADQAQAMTPVKQTIVTNPDGTQEMTIKGTPQALSTMNPNTPTVSGPVAPGAMPGAAPAPVDTVAAQEEERRQREQDQLRAAQMRQLQTQTPPAAPVAPVEPTPAPAAAQPPAAQPTAAPAPAAAAQPQLPIPSLATTPIAPPQVSQPAAPAAGPTAQPKIAFGQPIPTPPVQMAAAPSATVTDVTAPTTGEIPAAPAPAPAADYSLRFQKILSNTDELARVMSTSQDPVEKKIATDLMRANLQGQMDEQKALDVVTRAAQGDRQAQTQMSRDLKKEEGSYIKAILFSRLGLNQLAAEEQAKLGQGTRNVGSIILDGRNYTVETDNRGAIVRAWDDQGDRQGDRTISQLQSKGVKTGSQAFGFTGGQYTLPTTGEILMPRTNSISGAVEFVHMTGPKRGQVYSGQETPVQQRVSTQAQVDFNSALIKFRTSPNTAAATEALKFAVDAYGVGSPEVQRAQQEINQRLGPAALSDIISNVPSMRTGAPAAAPAAPAAAPAASPATTPTSAPPAATGAPAATQPRPGEPPAAFRQRMEIATASGKAGIERGQKRGESFDKIIDTEYREDARKGDLVSSGRKDQFTILERRDPATGLGVGEQIAGLFNAAQQNPTDQKLTIVRDIMLGKAGLPQDEISKRVALLNVSPEVKSALLEYNALNARIAAQTLRETAGPGSVSDAEQQANRAANVDIGTTPLLGAYQMMARSQFGADMQRYKADYAAGQTGRYTNATAFDRDFRKIQSDLTNTYRDISTRRNEFITRNGNTPEAIREGYKRFPVPQYDPSMNDGQGGWRYLKPLGDILK